MVGGFLLYSDQYEVVSVDTCKKRTHKPPSSGGSSLGIVWYSRWSFFFPRFHNGYMGHHALAFAKQLRITDRRVAVCVFSRGRQQPPKPGGPAQPKVSLRPATISSSRTKQNLFACSGATLTFLNASDTSFFDTNILLRGYMLLSLTILAKSLGSASPYRHLRISCVRVSRSKPPFVPHALVGLK